MPQQSLVITGLKEIDRRLARLEPRVQRKVVRKAMRSGMKVITVAVKALAPVLSGGMRSQVKTRAAKSRRRGEITVESRIEANDATKRTSPKTGKTVFYPAIVEYGRDNAQANDFMARAYGEHGETARNTALRELRRGIETEARGL